ncbi:hypothetical protein NZK35_30445 [Stieleria sp. ICT_E10.1]|uniref:hypothetical protein n=1 Tax=Stieleria sedimenti TaxID=2976331 RepID=UPI0021803CBD|nr:hypothetical protein [Stieleria sedimenti]MCS7470997.1 hypothetical protein [Stieleria sedimenti]
MGETIRYLMVAVAALISILQITPARLVAQGPSGGFEIPPSLSGAFGASESRAESSRGVGGSASASMSLPNFTGGVDTQRVGPRAGGPTTDPTTSRDRAWLSETTSGVKRPTTEPVGSTAFGGQSSSMLPNDLRSSPNRNTIATVGATQDPQSREAQLMANARESTASPSSSGSGASRGFGSLPSGVRLPDQGNTAGSNATFGSEFARNPATASPSPTNRPVYGPPTAQEANYDLSVFNANNRTHSNAATAPTANSPNYSSQNFGSPNSARTTAQQDLLYPGNLSGGAASRQTATGGSALGFPAADPRSMTSTGAAGVNASTNTAPPSVPSNWTYQQIAQLGQLFGIQPTDSRMGDKAFVNDLYASYREYLAEQQAAQASAETTANAAAPGRWPAAGVGAGGQPGWNLPGVQPPAGTSQPGTPGGFTGGSAATDPRFASRDGVTTTAGSGVWGSEDHSTRRLDVDPRLSQKDIDGLPPGAWSYDKYGNPIDKERYVLDRFGERVDEETQWELTIGRKRRMEEERLAKLDAERGRTTLPADSLSGQPSASDRLLAGDGVAAGGAFRTPVGGVSAAADRPNAVGTGAAGGVGQRDPGQGNRVPPADQAGIAGAIGRSNPYVNVFLLCSLVANAFLFISLHRLWYHHRDLIASSRMAASGMSNND